ncbi:Protein CBR-NDX-8 [Caenorhabditis briggsae]|uniref:Protein CBR-NDX-8 n=1 Tax=Caenorhabditis briggsae TaxID=6238 RepID=A8X5L7_CAEBR|nr:Protein CBR-NDX-8 [Caenorhabditis briggsae]CAP27928.2 Protein CBR-NDX-8 [Caenorhabditis briggsae]
MKEPKYLLSRGDEIKKQLDLTDDPSKPQKEQDAGVLILLHDDGESEIKVLLCVRSLQMRRHPGEVCFPGGMMDDEDGNDVRRTAIREAYEEVGIKETEDYVVLGNLPAFRARFGILIHPTVALLRRRPTFSLSQNEVDSIFWIPLSEFLDSTFHSTFAVEKYYMVHMFQFEEYPLTYGITALMCIIVAIGILEKVPNFSLMSNLTLEIMKEQQLSSLKIIRHVYQFSGNKSASHTPSMLVNAKKYLSDRPQLLDCPRCKNHGETELRFVNGFFTYLSFFVILIFGVTILPLFFLWVPFCVETFKDAEHYCPSCRAWIGTYRRLGKST